MILFGLAMLLSMQDPPRSGLPESLCGHWSGAVLRSGAILPLEVELRNGGREALIDVPTWGMVAMPALPAYAEPELTLPFGGARFRLRVDLVAGSMRGSLQPGPQPPEPEAITIELTRVLAPDVPAVTIEEVRFQSADGVELAGVVALPPGDGPHPGMVIVQGRRYGPRDQFRSHAVLAARRGIAGLAFDGRGTGSSGGDAGTQTLAQRLDDAQAALEHLRGHPRVDRARVGMLGHSVGGWVVPVVALRSPPVAFLVLHSGPAEPLGDQQGHVFQEIARRRVGDKQSEPSELSEEECAAILALFRNLTELAASDAPWSEIEPLVAAARATRWGAELALPTSREDVNMVYYANNPHDSTAALRATRTPLLALFGGEDFVVRTAVNVPLLEEHLRAAGNTDHRIVVFPGADHDLMIPAVEDGPYRWQRRPPGYFETLFEWVSARVLGG